MKHSPYFLQSNLNRSNILMPFSSGEVEFLSLGPYDFVNKVTFSLSDQESISQLHSFFPNHGNHSSSPRLFFIIQFLTLEKEVPINVTFHDFIAIFSVTTNQRELQRHFKRIQNIEVKQLRHVSLKQLHLELENHSFRGFNMPRMMKITSRKCHLSLNNTFLRMFLEQNLMSLGTFREERNFLYSEHLTNYFRLKEYKRNKKIKQNKQSRVKEYLTGIISETQQIRLKYCDLICFERFILDKQAKEGLMLDCEDENKVQTQGMFDEEEERKVKQVLQSIRELKIEDVCMVNKDIRDREAIEDCRIRKR